MPRLDRFFFFKGTKMVLSDVSGVRLIGTVSNHEDFGDGALIKTSPINVVFEDRVVSKNSEGKETEYELGEPCEEYKDFLKSRQEKISEINKWSLKGNRIDGYSIRGVTEDDQLIEGKVISQERSFVTLANGTKYFVQWRNVYPGVLLELKQNRKYLDMKWNEENFEIFGCEFFKPKLF